MKKIILLLALLVPLTAAAAEPTIRINEIAWMGTTVSSNDEWIELYNPTDAEVDLADWKIAAADGSPEIVLSGTVAAGGYFLLERSDDETILDITADLIYTGALGNTGEHLTLLDAAGTTIDEIITSESWPAGDNTTKQTMERLDKNIWATSINPGGTPKAANSQTTPPDGSDDSPPPETDGQKETPPVPTSDQTTTSPTIKRGDVVFTELLTNPVGPDQFDEFIELKNASNSVIDISSWQIKTSAGQCYTFPSQSLDPDEIVTLWRNETRLALNNTKETVTLYSSDEKIIDRLNVGAAKQPGVSYNRDSDGKWQWAEPSPEKNNGVVPESLYPIAVLYAPSSTTVATIIDFDGSDSVDPLNHGLSFSWDFGDGQTDSRPTPRKLFWQSGTYTVRLLVANGLATSSKQTTITVHDPAEKSIVLPQATSTNQTNHLNDIPFIFISEVLPNPVGSDTENEFIELFSQHPVPVTLTGWQLDDEEGGSKPFTFTDQTILPGQYLALMRSQTKLALNNDTDTVRFLAPGGQQVDSIVYDETSEGKSLVRGEDFGLYSSETPTPGEINTLDGLPKEPTSTPVVLGAQTDAEAQLIESPKTKDNRYLIASVSGALILGMAAGLKLRK